MPFDHSCPIVGAYLGASGRPGKRDAPKMPLTDVRIRSAKPKDKISKIFDSGGLYLEVSVAGGKYWRWKYRFGGKEKRLAFGVYPDVSLKAAREKRDAARQH